MSHDISNLNIGYSGGSGGFLLLHLLLLSGRYHTEFNDNVSFTQAFEKQWKIDNHVTWKTHETWPSNSKTHNSSTDLNKIYFFCNPYDDQQWGKYPGSTLILYTDYSSQNILAHYKKANWHYKKQHSLNLKFSAYRELLNNWKKHYSNIKDPAWPECRSFRDIEKLPDFIQQEILKNPYTADYLNYQYVSPVEKYQDSWVLNSMIPILKAADYVVQLQDLVNSNGSILEKLLSIPPMNNKQIDFLQNWKKLHPTELLTSIGIY